MMKKTLLLLALTVSVLGIAKGTFAVETDSTATTGGGSVTCVTKEKEWNGIIPGQFLQSTARPVVLLDPESKGKEAWDGYIPGSFDYWRPNR
jgi:hypothetical protein